MKCEFEETGYPHEGCAEFGPPDVFECQARAEWRFTYEDMVPYPGDDPVRCVDFCTFHGKIVLNEATDDLLDIKSHDSPAIPQNVRDALREFVRVLVEKRDVTVRASAPVVTNGKWVSPPVIRLEKPGRKS